MAKETVTITKEEYLRLLDSDLMLDCLYRAGVEYWDFYEEAGAYYKESLDEVID